MVNLLKQGLRRCSRCKEIKPLNSENFHKANQKNGFFSYYCRTCQKIIKRDYWAAKQAKRERCPACGQVLPKNDILNLGAKADLKENQNTF